MRLFACLALVGLVAAAAGPAAAGDGIDGPAVVAHIFAMADKDGNGSITASEYAGAGLDRYGVSFDECDADADGEMTEAEYLAIYEQHHPEGGRVRL